MKYLNHQASEVGSILLAVVLLLGLLGGITLHVLHGRYVRTKALQAEIHAQRANFDALQDASQQHISLSGSLRLPCLSGQATHGEMTLFRNICALVSNAAPSTTSSAIIEGISLNPTLLFPLIDYKSFDNLQPICVDFYSAAPKSMPSGQPLSTSALISKASCILKNSAVQMVEGNLMADGTFQGLTNTASATLLLASGFIDIPTTLNLNSPSLIIAAGDVYIKNLNSSSAVTVVSTSGLVQIDQLQGNPKLKVIAWLGALLPPLTSSADNNLLPPLRSLVVVSVAAKDQLSN